MGGRRVLLWVVGECYYGWDWCIIILWEGSVVMGGRSVVSYRRSINEGQHGLCAPVGQRHVQGRSTVAGGLGVGRRGGGVVGVNR